MARFTGVSENSLDLISFNLRWEGLLFVMLYGVYILAMRFNETIMDLFPPPKSA